MKLGILDIGTNSTHMILVDIKRDLSLDILDRAKELTRLGDKTFQGGNLTPEAIERGISAIRRFKKLAEIKRVQRIKAVATSAVREAANGGDFIDLILRETGIKVQVITGEEEARLIYTAVKHTIPLGKDPCVIVDIGGGSVEVIAASAKGLIECWSLKLGTIRLKDIIIKNDPPSKKEMNRLQAHVEETLRPILRRLAKLKIKTVIGTSGTIINLGTMVHWEKSGAPLGSISQTRLPADGFYKLHDKLIRSDEKARLKIKGIDAQRNDIIIPGSAVLTAILKRLKIKDVILCDAAIREGVVYEYAERNRSKIELESQVPDIRLRSILQLAKKCDYKVKHAAHVKDLALSVFDQTQRLHLLGPRERECLGYASLLHDIGYHISYKKHHKHSYYLIKNADLNGFEEADIDLIANITRYHAKSFPKNSHDNWKELLPTDRKAASVCAAILKLADGLDRSHFSVIDRVKCRATRSAVTVQVIPKGDPELEIWSANRKKDLFEKVFGKKVIISWPSSKEKASHG